MKRNLTLLCLSLIVAVAAMADLPFRNARWDSFHSLKPSEGDIVFVGNSITNMHQWWEAFGGQNQILNRGTSGGFTTEVLPHLETIIMGHPAKVFIGIGTNDICEQPSLDITADNVRIIAERIRRESPNTKVYIQSLIPSTNNGSGNGVTSGRGQRIPQVNALIKAKAEALNAKYGKVQYLDVFSQMVAADGVNLKKGYNNQSLAFDNLHPTALGYKLWCDYISEQVGFDCVYKEQQMVGGMNNNNAFGDCLSAFEQFKVKASDILMVGGDMIHNGEWHEFMKSEDFKNRGLGWGLYSININQLATIVDRAMAATGSVAPKAVVLYAGDKNSNESQSADAQLGLYKTALSSIKAKCPGSKIFVLSTMPNTDSNKNNIVTALNAALKNYAAEGGYTFVDAYTEIAKNKQAYMNGTNYVYTKGYAKIAQVLAAALNTELGTSYTALSDAEANANVEMYNARKELGDALTSALRLASAENIGDGIGQYSAGSLSEIEQAIEEACALLASTTATATAIQAKAKALKGVIPTLNPVTKANTEGKQFYLSTPNRSNRYVVGSTSGMACATALGEGDEFRWVFESRTDGKFNIKNVGTKTYAAPQGKPNQMKMTATAPTSGWEFKSSDAPGLYIIVNGDSQFNMSNNSSLIIYNWGDGTNAGDAGCQFKITEAEGGDNPGPGPEPKPEGTYTVDKDHGSLLRDGSTAGQTWNNTWKSTDGLVTFTASANNMQWNGNNIDARSGGSKSSTYTLSSTSPKYVIKNYGFKAKSLSTNNQIWAQGSKNYTVTSAAETAIAGTDVEERTVQFVLTGENTGTLLTEFTVELEEVQVDPTLTEPEVVTVLKNAGSAVPYRIPAIASTKDGVLVVAADYRFTKADIGGGRLDLHLRRSFDYGKTWEEEYIKPENMMGDGNCSGANDYAGFGDPCIVADRESNKMMILSCSGYPGFWSCTREQHQRCARWYSEDNGATWTGPEFIDNKFVFEPFDNHSFGPAQGMFFGSGKIHQSRYYKKDQYYRLYASNSVRNSSAVRNYVMYSDDFGLTWNFLGGIDAPAVNSAGDEPKVEELPDGSVLFSGRVNGGGGRNINIFKFTDIAKGQGAWMGCVKSNASNAGVTNDNACNGEIQLVPVVRKKDNKKMWLALQSVPFGSGRNNVGIFYKGLEDEEAYKNPTAVASNWEGKHQASWASSAYSTMVVQGNKHIGFVYEENGANGGYDIQYKDYTVEVLTDGKYSYDTEYDPETTVLPLSAGVITPSAGTVEKVEAITVSFNKPVTAKVSTTMLAEGVSAAVAAEGNTLTLTLASAITEKGVYELTIPAGVVVDADKQENSAVSVKYRILGEALELGAEVTSLDGIDEHKTYALYNPASTAYAMYAPQYNSSVLWVAGMKDMDASHKVSNPSYSDAPNFADPNLAWAVVNYNGEKYLFNVGAEMFVTVGRPTTLAKAPRAIKIEKISNGFAFNTTGGAQEYMCASPQLSEPIAVWTSSDAGSCWQLFENPNVEDSYELAMKYLNPEGIQAVINGSAVQTQTFDLMGRRVNGLAGRGIYIMGDRKVMR